jgi:probable F420-dependent oxidoreductase
MERKVMRLGAVFPNNAVGTDPGAIREFAQGIEDMGLRHMTVYDHVIGFDAAAYDGSGLRVPYREHIYNEPFTLFGYLAGLTKKLELVTGVLVVTQRQTALIAKQAAQIDVLSGGRLRLGLGTGWSLPEYEALNVPWERRGDRLEEQIRLLRELWTKPVIRFAGEFHTVSSGGINPLPARRPIPLWLGGVSDRVIRRVATMADGWMPLFTERGSRRGQTAIEPEEAMERLHGFAINVGRDPSEIGIDCRITFQESTPEDWRSQYETYRGLGASHITLVTVDSSLISADAHLNAIKRMKDAIS